MLQCLCVAALTWASCAPTILISTFGSRRSPSHQAARTALGTAARTIAHLTYLRGEAPYEGSCSNVAAHRGSQSRFIQPQDGERGGPRAFGRAHSGRGEGDVGCESDRWQTALVC